MPTHDIVVAGAGHNSLTTAAYAARAGFDVGVVEADDLVGGNTKTQEHTVPGLQQDTCSTAHNLIQASPTLKDDELGLLSEYGLTYLHPDPVVTVPFDDGTSLTMWRDREETVAEFAKFSDADAKAYDQLLDDYAEVAPYYTQARYQPPSHGSLEAELAKAPNGAKWIRRSKQTPREIIERRFEHPKTRAFMCYLALLTVQPIERVEGGLRAFSLAYGRQKNSWIIPEGGSGQLADALVACIEDHGGSTYTGERVTDVLVEDGSAAGVRTENGTVLRARDAVVSTIHVKHLPDVLPDEHVPEEFRKGLEDWKVGVTLFAAHFASKEPPRYETEDGPIESVAMGTASSVENLAEITRAFHRDELYLDDPFILSLCPTVADESRRTDDGHHSYKLVGKLPYDPDAGDWDDIQEDVTNRLLDRVRDFAPNLTDDVLVDMDIAHPVELERRNAHCYRGTCHGGDYTPDQYGENRPVRGYANYRGPVDGFYMTGACTWPGGSVSAAPGRNCATILLDDLGPGIEAGIRSP
jgi:phytoene dehydrogenase-like protein